MHQGKVWLKSGNVITLPPGEVGNDFAEKLLGHVAQGEGYISWFGKVILIDSVEAIEIEEIVK